MPSCLNAWSISSFSLLSIIYLGLSNSCYFNDTTHILRFFFLAILNLFSRIIQLRIEIAFESSRSFRLFIQNTHIQLLSYQHLKLTNLCHPYKYTLYIFNEIFILASPAIWSIQKVNIFSNMKMWKAPSLTKHIVHAKSLRDVQGAYSVKSYNTYVYTSGVNGFLYRYAMMY